MSVEVNASPTSGSGRYAGCSGTVEPLQSLCGNSLTILEMRMFGLNDVSVFDTLDHDKHRMCREPWNPSFSKQSVSRLQPVLIQPLLNKFCDRLAQYQAAGKPIVMTYAFSNLTSDIISEYSFPQGYGHLDQSEFHGEDYNAWMALRKLSHLLKQFCWLFPLLNSMPLWITKHTSPETYLVLRQQNDLLQQSKHIVAQREDVNCKGPTARPSMMQAFLDANLPESEKTAEWIKGEAQFAIAAGNLTTTHALKTATFHVLANPPIYARLMEELHQSILDTDSSLNLVEAPHQFSFR